MALMKQYAVDRSREDIRVSGVNAGRIRSGLLTDDVIQQRAAARGMSADQYISGTLLGVDVAAKDVTGLFLQLAQLDKVNAAVLTVDAGDLATALRWSASDRPLARGGEGLRLTASACWTSCPASS